MSNLLKELKESISETQHTVIRINKEDYEKVEQALFRHIWDYVYNHVRRMCYRTYEFFTRWGWMNDYDTNIRIVVCEEGEVQDIVKKCENPTTFFIIEDI
jgi:uncharacterized protein YydD (DUF2326 family)